MQCRILRSVLNLLRLQRGTTLIETLLALAILGSIGTVYLSAVSTGSHTSARLDKQATAERLVRNQLEEIRGTTYDDTVPYQYPVVDCPAHYSINIDVEPNVDNTLQKITVTVSHQADTFIRINTYKVKQS